MGCLLLQNQTAMVINRFLNDNFVACAENIRVTKMFKISDSLKLARFSFCAVVMAAANQRTSLLQ